MLIKNISSKDSIKHNLENFCYEVGSKFEKFSQLAVEEFIRFHEENKIKNKKVYDLGCGDGAATKEFLRLGYKPIGVDINEQKLAAIEDSCGARVLKRDLWSFVTGKFVIDGGIFAHHSFEHSIDSPRVIRKVSARMIPGNLYYVVVPAGDHLHSAHHVVFESPDELLPPHFQPIYLDRRKRFNEDEFICVALSG